jgi:amino acid transporter
MSAIHNERTKLMAGAFNTLATSSFTVGVFTPAAMTYYNFGNAAANVTFWQVSLGALFWLFTGCVLHYLGNRVLGRLL